MMPLVHKAHCEQNCCNIFVWPSRCELGTAAEFEDTLFESWSCIILSILKPVYAQAVWASTTCLGWLWCSVHWAQVHMVQRPAPGPPPTAGGSAAGPPAPVMQGMQSIPGMAVPFSSQSQVESDVREAKVCQAMAVALDSKREGHREHKYLQYLEFFLADRWPIRIPLGISTTFWVALRPLQIPFL